MTSSKRWVLIRKEARQAANLAQHIEPQLVFYLRRIITLLREGSTVFNQLLQAYIALMNAYPIVGIATLIGAALLVTIIAHVIDINRPVNEARLAEKLKSGRHGYLEPREAHYLKKQGYWRKK